MSAISRYFRRMAANDNYAGFLTAPVWGADQAMTYRAMNKQMDRLMQRLNDEDFASSSEDDRLFHCNKEINNVTASFEVLSGFVEDAPGGNRAASDRGSLRNDVKAITAECMI